MAVRRELNRVLLVLLAIGTLGALACSGGDDDAAAGAQATPATPAPTSTLEIVPTQAPAVLEIAPTQASSVLEIAPTQASSVLEIAPTQASSVLEIAPTQASSVLEIAPTQAPSVGPTDTSRDLTGFPFSTADLRQAIETAGYSFAPLTNIAPICPQTSVPEQAFWSVNLTGGDSGPILVLWVYPNFETLKADWQAEPGHAPQSLLPNCGLPSGFAYWSENLVMVFAAWFSLGIESATSPDEQSPGQHPAVQAFLELSP